LGRPDQNPRGPRNQAAASDITGNGNYNLVGNGACTPSVVGGGDVIISEFRLRGPTPSTPLADGAKDEFIELYNTTSNNIVIGGNDGGWALVANGGSVIAVIPNGTGIPAHGHYLIANSDGYSLGGYAAADQTYSGDLGDAQGLALFGTATVTDFTTAAPLDAVGFVGIASPYSEGTPLASPGANDGEYSFVRRMSGTGLPKDTGDNASDFVFVSTNAGSYGGVQSTLGAPGPENLSSPIQRNAQIKASLPDPQCAASSDPTSACGRVRDSSDTGANKSQGTLSFRRRFTNRTGFAITKLRIRIVDLTTAGGRTASQADLRALDSSDIVVTRTDGTPVTLRGTTVETPPAQPMGGGLNTSMVVDTITMATPLAPNAPVDVQIVTGVEAAGAFRFFVNVEALLSNTSNSAVRANTKMGAPVSKGLPAVPAPTQSKTEVAPAPPTAQLRVPFIVVPAPPAIASPATTPTRSVTRTKRTKRTRAAARRPQMQ
jgi:hypothetical protein